MDRYKEAMLDAINEIYNLDDKEISDIAKDAEDLEEYAQDIREWAIDIIRWHMNRAEDSANRGR